MPRMRTGAVVRKDNHYAVRITVCSNPRIRPWFHFEPAVGKTEARAKAKLLSQQALDGTLPYLQDILKHKQGNVFVLEKGVPSDGSGGETVHRYSERWLDDPERMAMSSWSDMESIVRNYVRTMLVSQGEQRVPLGTVPMAKVTQENMKEIVLALDQAARDGKMAEKTARNIWSVFTQMFADALSAKDPKLVCLKSNPCAGVRGPNDGIKKAKQYLFPAEFLQQMACTAIDLEDRQRDAVAVYTYMRKSEMKALEADAVNLDRRIIHVHQAMVKGKVKELKGRYARRIPIDPEILPVLRAVLARHPHGRLFNFQGRKAADKLRLHLKLAGVTREELFASSKTRKNVTWHDLRATGITWAAMRGDDLAKDHAARGPPELRNDEGLPARGGEPSRRGLRGSVPPASAGAVPGIRNARDGA